MVPVTAIGVVTVNGEPGPDIFEEARCEATGFAGVTDSTEELVAAVSELAQRDPRLARQAIETVTAHLDEATQGKRTHELERLEAAALQALGLDAKRMAAAVDDRRSGAGETGG